MRLDIFGGEETRLSDEGLSVRVNDLLGDIASENFQNHDTMDSTEETK